MSYSLCIPTSIISPANAKNLQQTTAVLYQVAKAASIYNVGEIIILDVKQPKQEKVSLEKKIKFDDDNSDGAITSNDITNEAMLIATILQYFITPPYLIKSTFKQKFWQNFQYAKNFPKLSTLPFMNPEVSSKYREGISVKTKVFKSKKNKSKQSNLTKIINIGYEKYLEILNPIPNNVRVTVDTEIKTVVSPQQAYKHTGVKNSYGYHVRIAKNFSSIWTESGLKNGYTKSCYINTGDYYNHNNESKKLTSVEVSKRDNLLLVLGKHSDFEMMFKQENLGVENCNDFFDGELEIPRGTRIEDGCLISLTLINEKVKTDSEL